MSDIHALSGAYAVDALDDTERTEFEQHLSVCAECRAEVASLRETAALLAETESEVPPASLRASVLSGVSQIRPLPPETTSPPEQAETDGPSGGPTDLATRVRRRRLPQLLAAAAAVVLLAAGALAWHPWQHDRTSLADQVLNAPDAMRVTERLPDGNGEITLVRSASLHRAVMLGDDVPDPDAGKTYQMWLQQPGRGMVSAGLMPDADEPTVLSGDAATATAAAVSVEPDGGSDEPTTDPIALFPLQTDASGNDAA
jgi:anti-sigma-K factor RskA